MHCEVNGKGIELKLGIKGIQAAERKASAFFGGPVSIFDMCGSQLLTHKNILVWASMLYQKKDATMEDSEKIYESMGFAAYCEMVKSLIFETFPEMKEESEKDEEKDYDKGEITQGNPIETAAEIDKR